jgi:streptogramin lyase
MWRVVKHERLTVCILLIAVGGCSMRSGLPAAVQLRADTSGGVQPKVVQNGKVPTNWTQLTIANTCTDFCFGIVVGPDKNMWMADRSGNQVDRVTMKGTSTAFPLPPSFNAYAIGVGADNDLYVTGQTNQIVRFSLSGHATTFTLASGNSFFNGGIVKGPDGNVWFTEAGHVGRITPAGKITEFAFPSGATGPGNGIAVGPDGNIWFTDTAAFTFGWVDPTAGTIREFPAHLIRSTCYPAAGLITGKDGNMWMPCQAAPYLAKVSTAGTIVYINLPVGYGGEYQGTETTGPNGDIWILLNGNSPPYTLTDFDPVANIMTTYVSPYVIDPTVGLAFGPDGNFWMTSGNPIDVFVINIISVHPFKVTLPAIGNTSTLTVTERGTTGWFAITSNNKVATVAQGTPNSHFIVTAVGAGRCVITVSDAIGNLFYVAVTVV